MAARSDRTTGGELTADDRARQAALFVVLAVTLVRCAWLMLDRVDLYPDEAQYWAWSLHPAFGYYSKPPMVAWLIRATTALLGEDAAAIRIAAPLLHFGTSLVIYELAARLYDARTAQWSAIAYATLPGVSASAAIISTDAPLLFFWAVALYAFVRAREPGGGRWWIMVGAAAGMGLLSKYAMAFWLLSALLYLLLFRDERRHLPSFLAAVALALAIYAPNFLWNWAHDFASYRHTRDNANLGGALFHPARLLEFLGEQFAVFGPVFFASLIAMVALARRTLAERRAALLACFALPSLAMMLVVSFLSRAQANYSAPTFVSAVVLVVAWLIAHGRRRLVIAGVVLDVVIAVVAFGAHDAAIAMGRSLPARYDPLHRLRGWRPLGRAVSAMLARHPQSILMADDREVMAALLYYVEPRPRRALKWNGDCTPAGERLPYDQFDIDADPEKMLGADFMLVAKSPDNVQRILQRFEHVEPIQQEIYIPLDRTTGRRYKIYWLSGFKGYVSCAPAAAPKD
jgi:4-amino-4-deoxy-L-arabinose transferase-like glycosyltransferase